MQIQPYSNSYIMICIMQCRQYTLYIIITTNQLHVHVCIHFTVINSITAVNSGVSNASFQCSFWDNQSYCLVCCSTDPSVSPDSSVYNISTSRGTEVTVDLDGLTSGQMYYCKAAATNNDSNSQNCTFPGFGTVNVFISFRTLHGTTGSGMLGVSVCKFCH